MAKDAPENCGLGPAFRVIGGKWKAMLLWLIRLETRRFGELKRLIPEISDRMLVQQLRELEADGLIERKIFHQVPPRVDYSATSLGIELDDALLPLADWGKRYAARLEAARTADSESSNLGGRPQ